jgi:uncharacterized membrane protein
MLLRPLMPMMLMMLVLVLVLVMMMLRHHVQDHAASHIGPFRRALDDAPHMLSHDSMERLRAPIGSSRRQLLREETVA